MAPRTLAACGVFFYARKGIGQRSRRAFPQKRSRQILRRQACSTPDHPGVVSRALQARQAGKTLRNRLAVAGRKCRFFRRNRPAGQHL